MNSKIVLVLFGLAIHLFGYSQTANHFFGYQAIVRDPENNILAGTSFTIKFILKDQSPQQSVIYAESHLTQSDSNGLIKLNIGAGIPLAGIFSDIDWNIPYTLDVEMDTGNGFTLLGTENLASVPYAQMARQNWSIFGNDNANTPDHFIGTRTADALQLRTNNIPRLHITASGKCGIGTTSPLYDFDIKGSNNVSSLFLSGASDNSSTGTILQSFGNQTELWNLGEGSIKLIVNGAPGITIDNEQRVGIGTWSPQSGLHVNTGADLSLSNPGSGFILMGNANNANMVLDQNEIMARNAGQTSTLFLNTEGGSVVINQNTTPGFNFAVNGTCAKPGGGSWSTLSDARLKQNVQPFQSGLSTILKINPVNFSYNEKSGYDSDEVYTGIIAQDLQLVAPEMVTERMITYEDGSQESYLTVDPSAFTYMLINAVQEQQKTIEELEMKVLEMEMLKQELEEIKSLLLSKEE